MPKIVFHSYRGNAWEFDIVSRRIAPAEPSHPGKAHQATDGRFFGDMCGMAREEFDDAINHRAEILILNVTDRCNLRCKYCVFSGAYCGQRVHGSATMSLDTAMRGIDQFLARTGKTLQDPEKKLSIGFYGGEPLLAFDLIREILDRVHGAGYSEVEGASRTPSRPMEPCSTRRRLRFSRNTAFPCRSVLTARRNSTTATASGPMARGRSEP